MATSGQTRSNAAVGCEISMTAYPTAPTVPLTIVCPHCNMLHIVASHPRMRGPDGSRRGHRRRTKANVINPPHEAVRSRDRRNDPVLYVW
jgi:hypothetical protein